MEDFVCPSCGFEINCDLELCDVCGNTLEKKQMSDAEENETERKAD